MPSNNDIVRAIGDAIVQAAEYVNRDANDYSKSSIKNARIYGNQIKQNSVPGFVLKDGSIPGLKIADLDFAKIKNVEIGNAHIANAGIDYAKIKDLHADSAYFGSQIFELGLGDELYMGRLRVNAANIAHLEVGELILESPDGTLYRLGVDEDGNVVTSVYEVQYQNIADMTKNLMSQYTIYRGATAPETPYVDQLWVNTDTDITKRCIAVTPDVIWEPVKASELHTSFINAVERGLEILSTGVIEVKSGGNIDIQSGGSLNVKASGGINVESGGLIKVHSTDAIEIGGYPLGVGGTNLYANSAGPFNTDRFISFYTWDIFAGLPDDTPVTISFDIQAQYARGILIYPYQNNGLSIKDSKEIVPSTSTFTLHTFTTSVKNWGDQGPSYTRGAIALYDSSGDNNYTIKNLKIEKGTVATDWSPSPQDTSSALASLNSLKNRIWYQPGVPTSSAENDIWYDTDADPVKIYRANAANVSAIVTSGNGWYDITSVALDQALKGLNSLGNGSYHFFQSDTRPKSALESGGSQINIGDIWLYTGTSGIKYVNGATYRAVHTNPTTDSGWLAFVAGAVLTPHIALNANHLTLSGESDLTIANPLGGNAIAMNKDGIAIESGSNLTIKDGSGGNVINMDDTGMTLSSTGQLKLQSTDSIIIGGNPFSVGGTNFYSKSTPYVTYTNAGTLVVIGRDQAGYENGFHILGPQPLSYNYLRLIGVITENGYWTVSFDIRGTQGWVVSVIVDICDSGNTTFYSNATDTYERKSLTVNVTNFSEVYNFVDFEGFSWAHHQIRNIKVEKGTMATDWSPSPQDTIDALDGIGTQITGLQARVQVFYQTSKPTYTAIGDLWYDTDSNPLEVWKCTNVSTQEHTAFTDPVLTRALSAQTTANSKIVTFVQSDTPSAQAAGDLWLDIGNKNIWKRATAAGTGGWVPYLTAAGYLNSTGITIDDTDLTVKATGNLNLAADGNLNVQNGGNLNVLNGGDIEISNGGDINVAAGGKINITTANDLMIGAQNIKAFAETIDLSANNSIKLAVSGGTNYYSKSTAYGTYTDAGTLVVNGRDQAGYENGFFLTGPQGSSNNFLRLGNIITENGYWTVSFDIRGTQDISVPVTVDICDSGMTTYYSNATNTYERKSLTVNVTNFSAVYNFVDIGNFGYLYYMIRNIKVEKGTMATDWSPAPSDPASGVKTSYIDIATDHIDISTGGNITMGAGALMKLLAAVVQIDASDASNSYINFGNAFNVSKGADGNFALTINSPTDNAIMVNNKPVWHKGNILVQQNQPASGSGVLWMKPVTTSQVIYAMTVASKSSSTYSGNGYKEYSLANQSADVMSTAGTYSFALKFTLRHYGDGNYTVSQITITLTKGGKTLTLYTGEVTVGGWSSKEVTATATTTDTDFTSGTGVINCKIQPSGTIPYSVSDFLAHEVGSPITATITGPGGGGSAQLCEVKYVP